jgi:branched-chain amino acid transport system ATP-binding protein
MTLLAIAGLTKRYGALVVADAIDLEVSEAEIVGILGPNGAGKTTLFNLIAGTVAPNAGRIAYCGEDVTHLGAADRCQRGIARSFQIPHPFVGLTVFENVMVGASFGSSHRHGASESRAIDALELTGLDSKANRLAGSLNLLDRKRLEMARAFATGPKLLLLDEIAGGLTEEECRSLIQSIHRIRARGISIVWIEHVVHALMAVADRLVVLDFGRKLADGEPARVIKSAEVQEIYLGIEADA